MLNNKTVMVFGTFDILHRGHENFFTQARSFGDKLVVVVARDTNVEKIKGKKPKNDEITRLGMLKQSGVADKVILGSKEDRYKRIHEIKPDIICLGYDQTVSEDELKQKLKELNIGHIEIIRLKPHQPNKFKSSKLSN